MKNFAMLFVTVFVLTASVNVAIGAGKDADCPVGSDSVIDAAREIYADRRATERNQSLKVDVETNAGRPRKMRQAIQPLSKPPEDLPPGPLATVKTPALKITPEHDVEVTEKGIPCDPALCAEVARELDQIATLSYSHTKAGEVSYLNPFGQLKNPVDVAVREFPSRNKKSRRLDIDNEGGTNFVVEHPAHPETVVRIGNPEKVSDGSIVAMKFREVLLGFFLRKVARLPVIAYQSTPKLLRKAISWGPKVKIDERLKDIDMSLLPTEEFLALDGKLSTIEARVAKFDAPVRTYFEGGAYEKRFEAIQMFQKQALDSADSPTTAVLQPNRDVGAVISEKKKSINHKDLTVVEAIDAEGAATVGTMHGIDYHPGQIVFTEVTPAQVAAMGDEIDREFVVTLTLPRNNKPTLYKLTILDY